MTSLIAFENKKFLHNRKNWIVFGILLAALIVFIAVNRNLNQGKWSFRITSYQEELKSSQDGSEKINRQFDGTKMPASAEEVLREDRQEQDLLNEMITARQAGDWKSELGAQIKKDQLELQQISEGHLITGETSEEIQERIALNRALLEKNIRPLESENEMNGFNFLYRALNDLFPFFIPVILVLLSADAVTSETDAGTFKFLLLQPASRAKVLFSKWISCLLLGWAGVYGAFLLGFAGACAVGGTGAPDYPVACYGNGRLQFMEVWRLVLQALPFALLFQAFLVCLAFFVTSFSPNSASAICISVILALALNYAKSVPALGAANPFSYGDCVPILTGKSGFGFAAGAPLLALLGAVLLAAGAAIFRRRDIL